MATVLLLNGPNLNLLGKREPELYGSNSLTDIEQLTRQSLSAGIGLSCFQSNHEGQLIDRIQQAQIENIDFIIFNPAGFTHTSVALRDALLAVALPFIEVHLSDPLAREAFRHQSYFSDIAQKVIKGQGSEGYKLAAEFASDYIKNQH
jgi:3-dehydroquinate dehydratase II